MVINLLVKLPDTCARLGSKRLLSHLVRNCECMRVPCNTGAGETAPLYAAAQATEPELLLLWRFHHPYESLVLQP